MSENYENHPTKRSEGFINQKLLDALSACRTWLHAALTCKTFHWDGDQHEAATQSVQWADEALKDASKGAMQWPRMPLMRELGGDLNHYWHVAINEHAHTVKDGHYKEVTPFDEMRFMYEAKKAAEELPRLALLFTQERTGTLPKVFKRCSHSAPQEVPGNHLTCCLGTKCKECKHLKALERGNIPPEEQDWIKAWTCMGHILSKGGDIANEGFILTVDDAMFWNGVHESLASVPPDITEQP